jgi:hypothetical protein
MRLQSEVRVLDQHHTPNAALYCGDSIELIRGIPSESVGLCLFSPPFPSMYAYTNSARDIGNTRTFHEMLEHFGHLLADLLRVTQPGRTCAVHLTQAVAFKGVDGYCGLKDFRGETIQRMEAAGWIYYGEVTIDKNPQLKAIRTKDRGLLFKTLAQDSSHMHMALADHLLQFRKPGENAAPIRAGQSWRYENTGGWITSEEWVRWARPVWYAADWTPNRRILRALIENPERLLDERLVEIAEAIRAAGIVLRDETGISEPDVLNVSQARDTDDERHLCPLQLGVIERAVKLWSNPGDVVFSPFMGIGSEVYQALLLRRKGLGFELKSSYFRQAVRNVENAESDAGQLSLMDLLDTPEPALVG